MLDAVARGEMEMPTALRDRPELEPGLDLYWQAFLELDSERDFMAGGPIPVSAIRAWADEYGLEGQDREELFAHVRALDAEICAIRKAREPKG